MTIQNALNSATKKRKDLKQSGRQGDTAKTSINHDGDRRHV
jgi:hypothetical protein